MGGEDPGEECSKPTGPAERTELIPAEATQEEVDAAIRNVDVNVRKPRPYTVVNQSIVVLLPSSSPTIR